MTDLPNTDLLDSAYIFLLVEKVVGRFSLVNNNIRVKMLLAAIKQKKT